MKTAIITGITGQDGAYLSQLLLSKNYKVIGCIRKNQNINTSNFDYLGIASKIELIEVNLLDYDEVSSLIKKTQPEEVYNLAAQSSVAQSFKHPLKTFEFNTNSVLMLLEGIKNNCPQTKFYQASSSEMFGNVKSLPIKLDTPKNPISPYGASKTAAHNLVSIYRDSFNLFSVSGILFNHESFLRSEGFFIKKIISSAIAIKNNNLEQIYVGNLSVKRDFGFAPKYVEAIWAMLQLETPRDLIICSGKSISLQAIVDYIFNRLELSTNLIKVDKSLFRENEIENIFGDNSEAKKYLNWDYKINFFDVIDILLNEELKDFKN